MAETREQISNEWIAAGRPTPENIWLYERLLEARKKLTALLSDKKARDEGIGALWVCYHALKDSQWQDVNDQQHDCPYCAQTQEIGHHKDCMVGNGLRMIKDAGRNS